MKKNLFLMLFFAFSSFVVGQVKTFSLEDAIKTALENNRGVKIAMMDVEKADAAVDEAFGYALPSVDLSANLAHYIEKPKTPFPDFEAMLTNSTYGVLFREGVLPEDDSKYLPMDTKLQSFAQTNNFESKLEVTQILFNSAVFRGIGASKIYLSLSEEQLNSSIAKTILDVKKAFYGVLLSKSMLEIVKASLMNAEDNLKNVKALHGQGLASDYDALQVEVAVENIRPTVLQLRNTLQSAKDGFKILLGIGQVEEIEVVGKIEVTDLTIPGKEEAVQDALNDNLDLKTLQIKRNVDEEMIAIERSDYWPTLAAFGNFTYSGSSDEWEFNTYNATMVGVSLTMNLFKGGQVANKVEQAEIAVKQTDTQINLTRDYVASQVKSMVLELEREKTQIQALTRNVELAQKAYDIARTRYNEGTGTQLEIKNADVELRTAKTNKLQSVHNFIISSAELDEMLGKIPAEYMAYAKKFIDN